MYHEIFLDVTQALTALGAQHGQGDLMGEWQHKRPWNVPGPLYTGDVDNSGPGPYEAPNNVFVDERGFPFIFRQPVNLFEVRQVFLAAYADPLSGYGADGNSHWDLTSIRAWWQGLRSNGPNIAADRAAHLAARHRAGENGDRDYLSALDRWDDYLHGEMQLYLRVYTFFVEEGRVPRLEDNLPDL